MDTDDLTDARSQRRVAFGPHRIFLSYRRSDSGAWAGRLSDDLRRHFGEERVFRDIDANRPSIEYRQVLDATLSESRVVITLIGPTWLSCADTAGRARLADPDDLVRIEIERAIVGKIPILPLFVGGATVPRRELCPESLRPLSDIEGMRLSDEDWRYDLGRIIERLETLGILPPNPVSGDPESIGAGITRKLTAVQRYERTLGATRQRVYRALLGAVEALRYPSRVEDPEAAQVRFTIYKREVIAKVVDAGPGRSTVLVELTSARTGAMVGGVAAAALLGPIGMMAAGAGLVMRTLDRRFAIGFLDNVQGVLEGRGIGSDSALPPGVETMRNKSREV